MIRNVILHLHNEQPLKADIESLPTAADAGLLCTNLRTLEGRKPLTTEYLDSVFLIPYNIIRFIEIPRASIDQAGLGMDLPIRPVQLPAEASGVSDAPRRHHHATAEWLRDSRYGSGRGGPGTPGAGRGAAPAHPRGMSAPTAGTGGAPTHRCYTRRP